jgi:hypothetical protein
VAKHKEEWPGWWFGPDGEQEVFKSPEEVPEGWTDDISKVREIRKAAKVAAEKPMDTGLSNSLAQEQRSEEATKKAIEELEFSRSQKELAKLLDELNKKREDKIEFLPNWPKKKLATLIVAHREG